VMVPDPLAGFLRARQEIEIAEDFQVVQSPRG
jgi:hypothetical protein